MEYSKILHELNNASLFELFRLKEAICVMLEDSKRINDIKNKLEVNQEVSYFDGNENRLIDASIVKLKRTTAVVINKHDGQMWRIPFYNINIDNSEANIENVSRQKVDRNTLKVGDDVCFKNRTGVELFGVVIKLNPKMARVLVGETTWRVAYSCLSPIIRGTLKEDYILIK